MRWRVGLGFQMFGDEGAQVHAKVFRDGFMGTKPGAWEVRIYHREGEVFRVEKNVFGSEESAKIWAEGRVKR